MQWVCWAHWIRVCLYVYVHTYKCIHYKAVSLSVLFILRKSPIPPSFQDTSSREEHYEVEPRWRSVSRAISGILPCKWYFKMSKTYRVCSASWTLAVHLLCFFHLVLFFWEMELLWELLHKHAMFNIIVMNTIYLSSNATAQLSVLKAVILSFKWKDLNVLNTITAARFFGYRRLFLLSSVAPSVKMLNCVFLEEK